MSNRPYLEKLLQHKRSGYVVFDRSRTLIDYHVNFCRYLDEQLLQTFQTSLWAVFPELIGNEPIVDQLYSGQKRVFKLERLSRGGEAGGLQYYNLIFYPIRERQGTMPKLFCLIEDVTAEAVLAQAVRQERYEVELLRTQLYRSNQFLQGSILRGSEAMASVRAPIQKAAGHKTTVLPQGESGTETHLAILPGPGLQIFTTCL